jgi:hypothetical protein
MATPRSKSRSISNGTAHNQHHHTNIDGKSEPTIPPASLLQPRVAVALGVPERWHRTLSICRLLSIVPCVWWGFRLALRFLVAQVLRHWHSNRHEWYKLDDEVSLRITETLLAGLWV